MSFVARDITNDALHTQAQHYADVRSRIAQCEKKPVAVSQAAADALIISELRQEVSLLQKALAKAQASLRFVAEREPHLRETEQKAERLELDLADARARILSQAELIKAINDDGEEVTDRRRTVPEIVAEVLERFPGVTWADVKSVRRTRELIGPRQACMKAVYDERKDLSLPSIGKLFCRDHTTILHAVRKVETDRGAA
ncbi:helix-turn-helix domain-containing protein [Rhizobium ruizarguesonis]